MRMRWMLLLVISALLGCGAEDPLASPTAAKLKGLGTIYLDYAVARGVGPADEAQLLAHMQALPEFVMQGNGLTAPQSLSSLTSERDGAPLVVRYGVVLTQISSDSAPIVAHEQHGCDGKCLVVYANGKVACLETSALTAALAQP